MTIWLKCIYLLNILLVINIVGCATVPPPSEDKSQSLTIDTEPSGAKITVNDVTYITPTKIICSKLCYFRYEIIKEGYFKEIGDFRSYPGVKIIERRDLGSIAGSIAAGAVTGGVAGAAAGAIMGTVSPAVQIKETIISDPNNIRITLTSIPLSLKKIVPYLRINSNKTMLEVKDNIETLKERGKITEDEYLRAIQIMCASMK
jgi:hypothetical protein